MLIGYRRYYKSKTRYRSRQAFINLVNNQTGGYQFRPMSDWN